MNMKRKTAILRPLCIAFLLLAACILSLALGSLSLSPRALLYALQGKDGYESARVILLHIRLPRMLGAILSGVGLALSGTLLQNVLGNPLASPNTVGVNAGAGLSCIVCLALCASPTLFMPFFAFIGAMAALLLILPAAHAFGGARSSLILSGIAVTTLLQSLISLSVTLDPELFSSYSGFSMGSLAALQLHQLPLPALLVVTCALFALLLSRKLTALTLGDEVAASLGVRTKLLRTAALAIASLSAAAAVSFAGLLGFIGLIVPHAARAVAPSQSVRTQILYAMPLGALTVLLADLAGRTLFAPSEIPVGIITALVGAPAFFFLLLNKRKEGAHRD